MTNLPVVQVPLPLKESESRIHLALNALGVGAGLVGAYFLLPILAMILKTGAIAFGWAIVLGAMGLAVAVVVPIIRHLWPYIRHQQKVWALGLAEVMIKIDPRRWIEIYIENHREKLGVLTEGAKQASAALATCKRKFEVNTELRNEARQKARLALEKGDKANAVMFGRAEMRKEKSLKRLERRIQILEFIVRALKKMRSTLEVTIADEEDELRSFIEEFETSKEVDKGIHAGMSALHPDEDQRRIKETAVAEMMAKVDRTHADLEMALEVFQPIIAAQDLEDEAYLERLNENFQKWQDEADSALLGPGGKQQLLAESLDPDNVTVPVERDRSESDFDRLIDR